MKQNTRKQKTVEQELNLPFIAHWDHACPDYQTLLELGVGGILEKIREEQKKTRPAEEQEYLSAMEKAVGAFQSWLYSLAAFYRGKDDLHSHGKRLEAIASRPPSSFWEAVQLVWLVDLALALEERGAIVFGRMDQYLYPFYLKENNSGSM